MNLENLSPEQTKAVESFVQLITADTDLETLEEALDASIWAVTSFKLQDEHFTGSREAINEIYWLRTLKEVVGGKVFWIK